MGSSTYATHSSYYAVAIVSLSSLKHVETCSTHRNTVSTHGISGGDSAHAREKVATRTKMTELHRNLDTLKTHCVQGETAPVRAVKAYGGAEVELHRTLPSALHAGERPASHPGRFTPDERARRIRWIQLACDRIQQRILPNPWIS